MDSACRMGEICDDSSRVCRAGCRTAATSGRVCPAESICDALSLTCMPGCAGDADCSAGRVCMDRTCRAGCRQHGDCALGQVCDPTTLACVMGCGVPGMPTTGAITERCPLGNACQPVNCQQSIGDPCSEFRCQPNCNGWMCNADAAHPWICYGHRDRIYSSRCLIPCTSDASCATGETCQRFAGDPDFADSDFTINYCDAPCRSDGDCYGAQWGTNSGCTCNMGQCVMNINGGNQVCKRVVPTSR
jgi:hypothetical protein